MLIDLYDRQPGNRTVVIRNISIGDSPEVDDTVVGSGYRGGGGVHSNIEDGQMGRRQNHTHLDRMS